MSKATKTASATKPAAKAAKVVKSPEQIEAAKIAKAEKNLATNPKTAGRVIAGSVRRAPEGSKYGKKLLCTINTRGVDGLPDGNTRDVATSDAWQVFHTEEVSDVMRKARQADKRAAAKTSRETSDVAVDLDAIEASL